MKKNLLLLFTLFIASLSFAQDNIIVTNSTADMVLKGNFDPADFAASNVVDHPQTVIEHLNSQLNTDTILSYLKILSDFENRNTGSDTVSTTRGMGAARRWAFSKFKQYGERNENRLLPSYLQFDQEVCGMAQHRNVFGILPGRDVDNHNVIFVEAHMDSRCEDLCDIDCLAEGVEDNGSGTALVLELARQMSQFTFDHTIVFLIVTGEEQGLVGANAFAEYCKNEDIPIKAVFNNDVVGGIICGETSSAPSCPGFNHVDSTQVRLFSSGQIFSPNKQLVRWIKMQYQDELLPIVKVPMQITLMSAEDRTGRGSDHIPFRQRGYSAMRFCSANEHGNANASDPDYHDRQHSIRDILGVDTDADGEIDSFFVDLNYLARNTVINGTSVAAAAQGVKVPSFKAIRVGTEVRVTIDDPENYDAYKIGIRTQNNDFDTLFTVTGTRNVNFQNSTSIVFISVAAIGPNGIESCFAREIRPTTSTGTSEIDAKDSKGWIDLFQNHPNPFDEATWITYEVKEQIKHSRSKLFIKDLSGKTIAEFDAPLTPGYHEILYDHGYNAAGSFIYGIEVDGQVAAHKRMIFAY